MEDRAAMIIDDAVRKGWTLKLLEAIQATRPEREDFITAIFRISQSLGAAIQSIDDEREGDFEKRVVETGFIDFGLFVAGAMDAQRRVCKINNGDGDGIGTGFLVGPDVILTNHHVVEGLDPSRMVVQFDHKKIVDTQGRTTRQEGRFVNVKDLLAFSEKSDRDGFPDRGDPDETTLDYALLELAEPVGSQPHNLEAVSRDPKFAPTERGWIQMPGESVLYDPGKPVSIVQHPSGDVLKLAFEPQGMLGLNGNKTRVRYKVNTKHGSSGSPVFNHKWELIGLHHYGGSEGEDFNQGIPIGLIRDSLEAVGVLNRLG
jgi:hypothetical protein